MLSTIRSAASPPAVQRHRILIIDDHCFFSFCLRTLIDREEELAVCDIAAGEEDLLERIAHFRPDLLLVDLSVGRQGGYDLARSLRRDGVVTPILFVSTADPLPRRRLAEISGAQFACKGGNPRLLIARIKSLLKSPHPLEAVEPAIAAIA